MLRVVAGVLAATAVVGLAVAAAPGGARQIQLSAARKSSAPTTTTSSTTTTTGVIPYGVANVSVSGLAYTASKSSTTIDGSFVVTNTGDTLSATVDQQRVDVEYKTSPSGAYQPLASSCDFVPAVPYVVVQQQTTSFTCQLAAPFPGKAKTVRITVSLNIVGSSTTYTDMTEQAL